MGKNIALETYSLLSGANMTKANWFRLPGHSPSLREVRVGAQIGTCRQERNQRPQECCLLAYFLTLNHLPFLYSSLSHLPRSNPSCSELDPPTLTLKKNALQTDGARQSDGGHSSVRAPSSRCARLTSKISHSRNRRR